MLWSFCSPPCLVAKGKQMQENVFFQGLAQCESNKIENLKLIFKWSNWMGYTFSVSVSTLLGDTCDLLFPHLFIFRFGKEIPLCFSKISAFDAVQKFTPNYLFPLKACFDQMALL